MDAVRILRVLDRLYRSSAFCLPTMHLVHAILSHAVARYTGSTSLT